MTNNHDNDIEELKKQGTSKESRNETSKVFKKSSPNGKITAYLGKRDFIDYLDYIDPVDGVILIDPDYIKERKVFVHVLAAFRYGREDLDVLGLTFRKDLYLTSHQVYPQQPANIANKIDINLISNSNNTNNQLESSPSNNFNSLQDKPTNNNNNNNAISSSNSSTINNNNNTNNNSNQFSSMVHTSSAINNGRKLTRLQERLIKKLGQNAYPFYFELPHNSPASVTLQPGPSDSGKPCGVDYELKAYVADNADEKAHKRNSVKLAIRKLTYAPEKPSPQPSAEVVKDFIMSPGSLRMEVSLDKEKYYHGESIAVNVLVDNNSNKTIKKIKITVFQYAQICLYSTSSHKCIIDQSEFIDGFPINPSQTGWCKVYKVCPLLKNNRDKRGLALDGKLKHEDTNLASSTLINENTNKENLGIIVSYKVKVRLVLGFGTSDVCLELPFTMSHPKPTEEELSMSNFTLEELHNREPSSSGVAATSTTTGYPQSKSKPIQAASITGSKDLSDIVDPDLIQLDTNWDEPSVTTTNHTKPDKINKNNIGAPITDEINISQSSHTNQNSVNDNNRNSGKLPASSVKTDDDLIFEDFARLRLTGGDL